MGKYCKAVERFCGIKISIVGYIPNIMEENNFFVKFTHWYAATETYFVVFVVAWL